MVPVWCVCMWVCEFQLTADKMQNKFLYFVSPTSWNKCTLHNKKYLNCTSIQIENMVSAEWNKKTFHKKAVENTSSHIHY